MGGPELDLLDTYASTRITVPVKDYLYDTINTGKFYSFIDCDDGNE